MENTKINSQTKKYKLMELHAIIEREILQLGWGTITFNLFLKEGIPIINTLNIVKQKRIKYNIKKTPPGIEELESVFNKQLLEEQRKGKSLQLIRVSKSFVMLPR